jgi:hypothetical protein
MEIKCRLIKHKEGVNLQPGDMFYQKYVNRKEEHLIVILPNGANFDITHAGDQTHKIHWDVTGEPPEITVSPSILMYANGLHDEWHGWLENGVLRDA